MLLKDQKDNKVLDSVTFCRYFMFLFVLINMHKSKKKKSTKVPIRTENTHEKEYFPNIMQFNINDSNQKYI